MKFLRRSKITKQHFSDVEAHTIKEHAFQGSPTVYCRLLPDSPSLTLPFHWLMHSTHRSHLSFILMFKSALKIVWIKRCGFSHWMIFWVCILILKHPCWGFGVYLVFVVACINIYPFRKHGSEMDLSDPKHTHYQHKDLITQLQYLRTHGCVHALTFTITANYQPCAAFDPVNHQDSLLLLSIWLLVLCLLPGYYLCFHFWYFVNCLSRVCYRTMFTHLQSGLVCPVNMWLIKTPSLQFCPPCSWTSLHQKVYEKLPMVLKREGNLQI